MAWLACFGAGLRVHRLHREPVVKQPSTRERANLSGSLTLLKSLACVGSSLFAYGLATLELSLLALGVSMSSAYVATIAVMSEVPSVHVVRLREPKLLAYPTKLCKAQLRARAMLLGYSAWTQTITLSMLCMQAGSLPISLWPSTGPA
eukprot:6455315-Amphidinium_carterae.2